MSLTFSSAQNSQQVDPLIRSHNATVRRELKRGDLIEFQRGSYSHWAVYVGDGMVVHLSGEEDDGIDGAIQPQYFFSVSGATFDKAKVLQEKLDAVILESKIFINNSRDTQWTAFDPDEIVNNALSRLGQVGYSVITQNCEHFAKWCRYGKAKSDQVDNVMTGIGVVTAVSFTAGLIAAVASYWGSTEEEEKEKKQKR